MSAVQERGAIAGCLSLTIAETLQAVAGLETPVVRSCHIGNAGAHNYGWLALARNTYLGPMEHTLYGVDDIYLPWAVLGDGGVVEACYNHRGEPMPRLAGRHANDMKLWIPRTHRSLFNFGIFAEHEGGDLVTGQQRVMADLARQLNGSDLVPRSAEALALRPVLSGLVRCFHRRRRLDALFNKWVRRTRSGHALMLKIERIEPAGTDGVAIHTDDGKVSFRGSIEALTDSLFAGLEEVSRRLAGGGRPAALGYPWINVFFNLLLNAVKEHAAEPARRVFWHAGATTNHLYIHQDWFQREFARLAAALEEDGFLPPGAELRIIPTLSCQLFATSPGALGVLEELIACWRERLWSRRERAARFLAAFERATDPGTVVDELFRELEPAFLADLGRLLAELGARDAHRLPIAYLADSEHPTYNKYGIAQKSLRSVQPLFPAGLESLTWGEAELLVRMLARLVTDRAEAPGQSSSMMYSSSPR